MSVAATVPLAGSNERPLRVVQLIPTMDRCGAEKQVCLLAGGLDRQRFDSHVVLLTRGGPRTAELDAAGVPWTLVGKRAAADPFSLFRLRRVLQRLQPDVLHCWIFAANSYGRAVGRWLNIPVLIAGERCVDPWKTVRHDFVDRALARITDAIITNSTAVRDFYAARGLPPDLFRIIPNGIAPPTPSTIDRAEACRRLRVPEDALLIGSIGRLAPQKCFRDLIWAAELLGATDPRTRLVIIGEGQQEAELKRYRDDVTQHERVRFVGRREDVSDLLPHFDFYWHGSAYEGQSNAILEAMQAAVPVIATDIPGMRDLIRPHETGTLVPHGDSAAFARETHRLVQAPDTSREIAMSARQRVADEFSVERMVQAHENLYSSLFSAKQATASGRTAG